MDLSNPVAAEPSQGIPGSVAVEVTHRYDRLLDDRRMWDFVWQELADYIVPHKSNIIYKRFPGMKMMVHVYDSTAIHASTLLASSLSGSLTSPATRWFSLQTRKKQVNQIPAVSKWLEDCADVVYFNLGQSNFNSEINECYQDLGAFGTCCLYVGERQSVLKRNQKWPGFNFRSVQPGEYVVEEDEDGRVDTVIRKMRMTARQVVKLFGTENCSAQLQKRYQTDPDQRYDILHAVYPRQDIRASGGVFPKDRPFASIYVEYDQKHLLYEGGFYQQPYLVCRWSKISGETYGRGPGHLALPDIRTLNKADELTLRSWAKAVDPPLLVLHDAVIGQVSLIPAAKTVVTDKDAVTPLQTGANFEVTIELQEARRKSVRSIYYSDQLQMNNGPSYMTATEAEIRWELMQRLLGPTLGRLEAELLTPLVNRDFDMLYRAGQLPEVPQELIDALESDESKITLDVVYEGPLARAQRGGELTAVQKTLQAAIPVIQLDPKALNVLDTPEIVRFIGEASGLPANLLRDKATVDQKVAQQEAQQQQVQQQQQQNLQAQTMGAAAPAMKAMADAKGQQSALSPKDLSYAPVGR